MQTRQNELNEWLKTIMGNTHYTITPLAGDASFRRYYRLYAEGITQIVMDAPPEKEAIGPFIHICHILREAGVHAPLVVAAENKQGFMLLEDFGDLSLLAQVSTSNADALYSSAMATLRHIQQCPTVNLPHFNQSFMLQEISLFSEWFIDAYLGIDLNEQDQHMFAQTFDWLCTEISKQPQVFIHRDYHSRNIMVITETPEVDLGIIDFQDAMLGPIGYDLVSLLKDCYIQWPVSQVHHWVTHFYNQSGLHTQCTEAEFIRWFDLCGLQRHLKVLGIFCRLHLRDKKDSYLKNLPLTVHYFKSCLQQYEELKPFYEWIQHHVHPLFLETTPS
jgi:aminoglycoside/choline kinase family phosphotransferase